MIDGVTSTGNGGMPGILRRARSSNAVAKPLSGDILRAFDNYNTELAAAAEGLDTFYSMVCESKPNPHPSNIES